LFCKDFTKTREGEREGENKREERDRKREVGGERGERWEKTKHVLGNCFVKISQKQN
jgi:hypothetical protein